jgi:acyl carrier protein
MGDLTKSLNQIVSKILLLDEAEINDHTSRKDVKTWDSMTHLLLITELETAFGVMMSDDDIKGIRTVGDIKTILRKLDAHM